jgi:hypothetical protein
MVTVGNPKIFVDLAKPKKIFAEKDFRTSPSSRWIRNHDCMINIIRDATGQPDFFTCPVTEIQNTMPLRTGFHQRYSDLKQIYLSSGIMLTGTKFNVMYLYQTGRFNCILN